MKVMANASPVGPSLVAFNKNQKLFCSFEAKCRLFRVIPREMSNLLDRGDINYHDMCGFVRNKSLKQVVVVRFYNGTSDCQPTQCIVSSFCTSGDIFCTPTQSAIG